MVLCIRCLKAQDDLMERPDVQQPSATLERVEAGRLTPDALEGALRGRARERVGKPRLCPWAFWNLSEKTIITPILEWMSSRMGSGSLKSGRLAHLSIFGTDETSYRARHIVAAILRRRIGQSACFPVTSKGLRA